MTTQDTTATVVTNPCPVCGERSTVEVPLDGYIRWQGEGALIQDAFPDFTPDEREVLITGYHPACWDDIFGEEE